jgi:hypothetical protein
MFAPGSGRLDMKLLLANVIALTAGESAGKTGARAALVIRPRANRSVQKIFPTGRRVEPVRIPSQNPRPL